MLPKIPENLTTASFNPKLTNLQKNSAIDMEMSVVSRFLVVHRSICQSGLSQNKVKILPK